MRAVLLIALSSSLGAGHLDMCEIKSLKPLVGRRVTVDNALLYFTLEGAGIDGDHCSTWVAGAVLLLPNDPELPNVGFDLDFDTRKEMIRRKLGPGPSVNTVCGTVDGEFILIKPLKRGPIRSYLLQNKAKFGFVLHSISEARDCLRPPEPIVP